MQLIETPQTQKTRPQKIEYWWQTPVLNRRAWTWEDAHNMQRNGEWWQNATIYQISPQSFQDSDGNGTGDLDGIIDKLDYITSLGVDALWLCPIYESPMEDFGYDITDMRDIDPLFGSLNDFKRLLNIAHSLGLKIIIDQVWSHTSNQHPWFLESRKNRDNSKADWYIWADPKPDGSPPNNWLSAFMGKSAWQWAPEREQFYMFNFLSSQPDLNWHNPEVVNAVLERAKFWLDLGIDGIRIDAPNFFMHDPQLRDNPARPADAPQPEGVAPDNPMVRQMFKYNFCRPETLEALKPIRELIDQYPGVVTLGEVTLCDDSIALASDYVAGDKRLHMAYHSGLLIDEPISANLMRRMMEKVLTHFTQGGDCWIVGNHDYGRLRSRWTGKDAKGNPYPEEFYHMIAALLLSLPGAICLYQGDELGLTEARIPEDIPPEEIKDPFGQALYPAIKGRDSSRTPMPWNANEPNAGFTTAEKSWLPIPKAHYERAVNLQNQDPKSLLNTWRRLLHWRKKQPAMEAGNFEILDTEEPIFAFIRQYAEQRLLCIFNISDEPVRYDLSAHPECEETHGLGFPYHRQGNNLEIPGYSVFFGELPST
ncbi:MULTISPECIES: alpha-glucosidase family protein [unclassified Coleofasciculus]|uniref:alpha-glucosidase family protein n=1 Tax=unclassified Coleofasciculus TaxID=2692782 RepID=UPI00187F4B54|nr:MULTISPECIES: alpha-glucosidase family protein [unclassified Coleofasciculus]MBE9125136.1 alpha-glucosidase [Coleofasciculus sp. LEGE 07081]MBE9148353.1 alpha-glucosidase [Coleofasciculus sp. LEGE 07092]